jgi:hypothetical protein
MPRVTLDGKRRFFFTSTDDEKDWRVKEKIVAVIESILQPIDAFAFSPKRVKNLVGDLEELDVVFQPIGDPTEPFSFVQVRNRGGSQGRPWLQQLIGQQETLGLRKGTLVSTSGFADTARKLASAKGIPIRTLSRDRDGNIGRWFRPRSFGVNIEVFSPVRCSVVAISEGEPVTKEFENDDLETGTTLIADYEADLFRVVPPRGLFDRLVMSSPAPSKWLSDVLERDGDGARGTVTVDVTKDRSPVWLGRAEGERPLPVMAVVFFVEMNRQSIEAPVVDRYRYEDAQTGQELAEAVIGEFTLGGVRNYIALVRTNCDGGTCKLGGGFFA